MAEIARTSGSGSGRKSEDWPGEDGDEEAGQERGGDAVADVGARLDRGDGYGEENAVAALVDHPGDAWRGGDERAGDQRVIRLEVEGEAGQERVAQQVG